MNSETIPLLRSLQCAGSLLHDPNICEYVASRSYVKFHVTRIKGSSSLSASEFVTTGTGTNSWGGTE